MNLAARCRQAVRDLNQAKGWGLPTEALERLCERVARFISPNTSPTELTRILRNYYQDGLRYEAMLQPDPLRRRGFCTEFRDGGCRPLDDCDWRGVRGWDADSLPPSGGFRRKSDSNASAGTREDGHGPKAQDPAGRR